MLVTRPGQVLNIVFFAFLTSSMDSPCKNTQDRGAPPRENFHVDKKKYSYWWMRNERVRHDFTTTAIQWNREKKPKPGERESLAGGYSTSESYERMFYLVNDKRKHTIYTLLCFP